MRYCTQCGTQLDDNALFCPNCGKRIDTAYLSQQENNNSSEAVEKPIQGSILGFLLTFFLGAVGLVVCVIMGDQKCTKASLITFLAEVAVAVAAVLFFLICFVWLGVAFWEGFSHLG